MRSSILETKFQEKKWYIKKSAWSFKMLEKLDGIENENNTNSDNAHSFMENV